MTTLSQEETLRYRRHLVMPDVGPKGQEKLKRSSVLLIGAGGLGSPAALYLAAAGVGRIGIVDFDTVDHSNLQRQILYDTEDVNRPKLDAVRRRLERLNPNVQIDTYNTKLTAKNARAIFSPYDVIIDGSDNFPTRYLVSDASVFLGKPNVYGAIFQFEGQASVFDARRGPCYRCLYPDPPPPGAVPSCADAGVLGILPGMVGSLQATEAVKLLLDVGRPLIGRLILYDALQMQFRELRVPKNPTCPVCSERPTIVDLIDYERFCGQLPAKENATMEITVKELKEKIDRGEKIVLLDVREPNEFDRCRLPGATLIPLREIAQRAAELNPSEAIVTYCHHGQRSMAALMQLRKAGFENVLNLRGGIDAWSAEIDPAVPRY